MNGLPPCTTFQGTPCAVCRTCNRINWLISPGKLAPHQEGEALQALRDCAGRLQDLVETSGLEGADLDSGPGDLSETLSEHEDSPVKDKGESKKKAEEKKKSHSKHKDKSKNKDKKERKKDSKKDKTASPEGEEGEAPPDSPAGGKLKKSRAAEEGRLEEDENFGLRNPGGESASSGLVRPPPAVDDLQSRVDEFATRNPRSFELGTLPHREGRDHGETREVRGERDLRRPREPDHPPPEKQRRRGERGDSPSSCPSSQEEQR